MVNYSHRRMKEEEGRRIAVEDAFQVAEKSNKDLKAKLAKEEKERKFVATALSRAEKQVESQQLVLRSVEDQLVASKEQIATLKRKLEEARKAKTKLRRLERRPRRLGKRHYKKVMRLEWPRLRMPHRAVVLGVCRIYCAQVWVETLNQARVEPSSVLRKAENIYYPPAIRAPSSSSSKTDAPPEVVDLEKQSLGKVPPLLGSPTKLAEQPKADEKGVKMNKEVAFDGNVPPAVS